jgi:Rrf2 family cysteine metabolism transcriptional repressor
MRLPTRVRYAVRAVAELAERGESGPVPVKDLARAQGISPKYAKQLMSRLQRKGIVRGHPGLRGGYTLPRSPAEITVLDVYRAMGETVDLAPCVAKRSSCKRLSTCAAGSMWVDLSAALEKQLRSVTIDQLAVSGRTSEANRSTSVRACTRRPPKGRNSDDIP